MLVVGRNITETEKWRITGMPSFWHVFHFLSSPKWCNNIENTMWKNKNVKVYLSWVMGALQWRMPCAQWWAWPDCAEGRNLLGLLYLLTHLSRGGRERERKWKGEKTFSLQWPFSLDLSPFCPLTFSHPSLISQSGLVICKDSCLVSVFLISLSLPPSHFLPPCERRSRGRGEKEWREGQVVRMREGRNRTSYTTKTDRWSFLLMWVSLTSLQPSVGCVSPLPWPQGCSAELYECEDIVHEACSSWNCSRSVIIITSHPSPTWVCVWIHDRQIK